MNFDLKISVKILDFLRALFGQLYIPLRWKVFQGAL